MTKYNINDANPDTLLDLMVLIYNYGYKSGHHDTVEAVYVDVHWQDMQTYHKDIVEEILEENKEYFASKNK